MTKVFGIAGDALKQYIEKVERLEVERIDVLTTIKEVFSDAKAHGFDPKIMRQIIRERKMEKSDLDEQETLLATYKRALGMLPELDEDHGPGD